MIEPDSKENRSFTLELELEILTHYWLIMQEERTKNDTEADGEEAFWRAGSAVEVEMIPPLPDRQSNSILAWRYLLGAALPLYSVGSAY